MKYFVVPTSQTFTWYTETVNLSGTTYVLVFRFNKRMGRWILDINDVTEQPILTGIPLLVNRNLTTQYTSLAIPEGALFVLDLSGQDLQPSLSSFLKDHRLYYADPTQ